MTNFARIWDICAGHGCWPSRPNDQGSPDTFCDGRQAHRQTDHWMVHCCPPCHDGRLLHGSPTVFTNGLEQGRVGDPVDCGSHVLTGSPTVWVGTRVDPDTQPDKIILVGNVPMPFGQRDIVAMDFEESSKYKTPHAVVNNPSTDKPITQQDIEPAKPTDQEPVGCDEFTDNTPMSTKISRYYTLADLSSNARAFAYPIKAQRGLTKSQIMCNLKALAVNVLDPLYDKLGSRGMFVTNAFRHEKNGTSQHELGLAADVQFTQFSKNDYYEFARWVKDNIAYDQFILEYFGTNPWFHLSYNPKGNRSRQDSSSVMTQVSASSFKPGLHNLFS